jgi:ubiquinone/menaquinone biosynthesis C-methylase UbiE
MIVKSLIISNLQKVRRLFVPPVVCDESIVCYENVTLPARHLRFCGSSFQDDGYFFASALKEADRLIKDLGLTVNSRLLDVGCGPGRLPIGILNRVGKISEYRGVDATEKSIQWCQRHIERHHPNFQFIHINVKNLRYNPGGEILDDSFRLPFKDKEFDIIYLFSVFSHMTNDDVDLYLREFQRILAPKGRIFLTAYVEEGAPDMSINPSNYLMKWSGQLHCVRYSKNFIEVLLSKRGFKIDRFDYQQEADGQSGLYLSHR